MTNKRKQAWLRTPLLAVTGVLILYILLMGFLSFQQESMIFFPEKLPKEHAFTFGQPFEEVYIRTEDNINLHGLLFKTAAPKGLIFYLHGNAGSVNSWGEIAGTYTALGYDLFILDYRGYGKSEGIINSEAQFYADVQATYSQLNSRYPTQHKIIIGYSIGTGPAAMLASRNQSDLLVLQAPYYSLGNLVQKLYPIVPGFILKYKFETFRFVEQIQAPIVLFHGNQDEVIYPGSSEKLKAHLKPSDKVILLEGLGHNGMNEHPAYQKELTAILAQLESNNPH